LAWYGYFAVVAALVLVFVHRVVARRYLDAYVAAYGRLPGWDWIAQRDEDAKIERWRLRRIAVLVPELVLFLSGIVIIANSPV
jgi:hypothetical protein